LPQLTTPHAMLATNATHTTRGAGALTAAPERATL
jgi:hypothetical protein